MFFCFHLAVMSPDKENTYKTNDNHQYKKNLEVIHLDSSLLSKKYPKTRKIIAANNPNPKALVENFSDKILPTTGAAIIILLKSYEYLVRFFLCLLFIIQSYHSIIT